MLGEVNEDFRDLLELLVDHEVEFLVVGAYALALHGVPRTTGDIDFWIRPAPSNARRTIAALTEFGAPLAAAHVDESTFTRPGMVYQIGLPPRRIDLLTGISGVEFDEAWASRETARLGDRAVHYISREHLLRNKRAAGRAKDLADIERLGG